MSDGNDKPEADASDKPDPETSRSADATEAETETETETEDASEPAPTGAIAKLRAFFTEYGPLGVVVWFSIFFSTWGAFFLLLNAGVDLGGWLSGGDGAGFFGRFLKTGGVGALAYGATQVVKPIRFVATFAITPPLHRLLQRVRGKQQTDDDAA